MDSGGRGDGVFGNKKEIWTLVPGEDGRELSQRLVSGEGSNNRLTRGRGTVGEEGGGNFYFLSFQCCGVLA